MSATDSPGARAVAAFEISDVFLIESKCSIAREFNPTEAIPQVSFQHRISPENQGLNQTRCEAGTGREVTIVRYFIDCGMRVLRPDRAVDPGTAEQINADDVLAEITAKLAVDYVCPKAMLEDLDAIGSFTRNAVFHAWPHWRVLIHMFSDQMRLPRVTLPMLKPGPTAPRPDALAPSEGAVPAESSIRKKPRPPRQRKRQHRSK